MNPLLQQLLARHMAPAGDDGTDTSGTNTVDTDVAVVDDDDAYMALSVDERRRLRGDSATNDPSPDTLAALVAEGEQHPGPGGPAAASAEPEDAGGDKGGNGIPRARVNEINEQRKAAEARAAELEAELARARSGQPGGTPPAAPQDVAQTMSIQEAEEQYAQLMLDGDTKGAAALRLQINAAIEESAIARFSQANASELERTQANNAVDQMMQQFPWLESPDGAQALELIEASVVLKVQRGISKAQAIRESVQAIAPRFAPDTMPAPYGVRQDGAASGDMRTQRANERGAAHSLQQPPLPQAGMGNRTTPVTVDTSRLSDEEYMALPEAERKKARGD